MYRVDLRSFSSAVRVDDSVSLQVVHQDEGFAALRAAVGPLAAVRALVHPQAALLREPLPALPAAERLLARVRPVVDAEVGRALEALPAHRAPERPLPLVALLVQLELVQTAERLATLRADEAPRHAGERFVGGVMVIAAWRVVRSIPSCLSVRALVRLVSLRVALFLLPVRLRQDALRSGLKARRLRTILLILATVDPVTRPLRRRLLATRRLASSRNQVSI